MCNVGLLTLAAAAAVALWSLRLVRILLVSYSSLAHHFARAEAATKLVRISVIGEELRVNRESEGHKTRLDETKTRKKLKQ